MENYSMATEKIVRKNLQKKLFLQNIYCLPPFKGRGLYLGFCAFFWKAQNKFHKPKYKPHPNLSRGFYLRWK